VILLGAPEGGSVTAALAGGATPDLLARAGEA